jgi:hypothetical protein
VHGACPASRPAGFVAIAGRQCRLQRPRKLLGRVGAPAQRDVGQPERTPGTRALAVGQLRTTRDGQQQAFSAVGFAVVNQRERVLDDGVERCG